MHPIPIFTVGSNLFIANTLFLFKTDLQLNILLQVFVNSLYNDIYYNSESNLLYMTTVHYKYIQYYDLNLVYIGRFSVGPYYPWTISGYNNQMFVRTVDSNILKIVNQTITNSFMGFNGYNLFILSILFDNYGNIVTACGYYNSQAQLYLYDYKGNYQNLNISLPNSALSIGFDSKSQFVALTWNNVYIYN